MDPTLPHPPTVPPLVLRATRDRRRAAPASVPVMPGVAYLATLSAPLWRQHEEANLARCAGLWHRHRSGLALAGSAAALVHGLWITQAEPDLLLLSRTHPSRSTLWLPGVSFRDPATGRAVPGRTRVKVSKRLAQLHDADVEAVGPLLVTGLMRTAVDCAFDLPPRHALPIVDSAMRALVRPRRFHEAEAQERWLAIQAELLARVATQGRRPGAARARAVVAIASPFAESAGESVLRFQVHALGLPTPAVQHRVDLEKTYFLDVALIEEGIDLEYDGRGKYATTEDAWAEKLRQDALTRAGWRLGRFTGKHLARPSLLAEDILHLIPPAVAAKARPRAVLLERAPRSL